MKTTSSMELNGKPIITYTIDDAFRSNYINRVIVTTDDIKFKSIA